MGAVLSTILAVAIAAIVILGGLYLTGRIDFDFTQTPAERAAVDPGEPGPPYIDGRHYAVFGVGDTGARRVYTFELVGEGESGALRIWEDETGRGGFAITGETIRIEMERMVPPERHEIWEPNVFEGAMAVDGARIEGTWSRQGWGGQVEGVVLDGEWTTISFYAERL